MIRLHTPPWLLRRIDVEARGMVASKTEALRRIAACRAAAIRDRTPQPWSRSQWLQTISPDLIVRYFAKFGEMAQQSKLKRMISMNWDRQTHHTAGFSIDVMTAIDAQQSPPAALDKTSKLAAG